MQALALQAGRASAAQALADPPRPAEPRLRSGFGILDEVLDGFERGRFTFVDASVPLLWDLTLGAACGATREGGVVAVDGGNSLDPYLLAAYARRLGIAPRRALGNLRVARAFTAYQLSAILEETLPDQMVDAHPDLLLVSCLPSMYMDEDVPWVEANALVDRAVALLREQARTWGCAVVATNLGAGALAQRPRLRSALYRADRVVRMLPLGQAVLVEDWPAGRRARLRPAPGTQRTLRNFHEPAQPAPLSRGPMQLMVPGAG